MMLSDPALDALLKRLHLANTRRAWRELARRAEQEAWTYHDFLTLLISEEIAHRQQTRLDRLVRRARFPFLKTIEDFNFTYQSIVRLALLGSALAPDFVTDGRCLILSGKPGRGKTHLAVAIAYRAIQNGFDARFVTAAELIDDLSAAFRSGRLADSLATYIHPGVLVIDEVGYLTYGTDAANMLFHVVNDRHRKKRAMIFTTNKPLTAWGRVLHDEDLAQAIVDRILERGRVLPLDGPSLRTKHLGLDDPTSSEALHQPARISGIEAPEFPEPTVACSGGGGSRSARSVDFSNNLNKLNRSIGEIREKAEVQVQNRYSGRCVGGPRACPGLYQRRQTCRGYSPLATISRRACSRLASSRVGSQPWLSGLPRGQVLAIEPAADGI
jgi:DNA replication protein DnaC